MNSTSHTVHDAPFLVYTNSSATHNITVDDLEPKTKYQFTVELFFRNSPANQSYTWPTDDRFIFETLPDRPSSPGKPVVSQVTDAVFKVTWDMAKHHGSPIVRYSLEVWEKPTTSNRVKRLAQPDEAANGTASAADYTRTVSTMQHFEEEHDEFPEDIWTECYNGTDNYWIIDATKVRVAQSTFRVRAVNEFGFGPFSEESSVIGKAFITADRKDYLLLAIFIPVAVSVFVVMAGCMILGELGRFSVFVSELLYYKYFVYSV